MDKKLNNLFSVFSKLGDIFLKFFPKVVVKYLIRLTRYGESKISFGLRYILYKRICKKFGEKVIIFPAVYIFKPENLEIGTNVSIHEFSYIDATGGITIGDHVMIAHRTTIMSTTHEVENESIPYKQLGVKAQPIIINNNCWIGADVKIINGVSIGNNSVVGAGSLVNKNIKPNSMVAGIPAKLIKKLRNYE